MKHRRDRVVKQLLDRKPEDLLFPALLPAKNRLRDHLLKPFLYLKFSE